MSKPKLVRGYYRPTDAFRAIPEHVAIMHPDGSLVAVCGPAGDPASEAAAVLFAAAPALLDELKYCLALLQHPEGGFADNLGLKRTVELIATAGGRS